MNLYLRLIWVWLRARCGPPIRLGDTIELPLTVWPNDLDLNGHMNNGRYMTIADLALVAYMTRAGFVGPALARGWRPMLGGAFISFRRGLKPFSRYRLRFGVVCWDPRWTYMRFEFVDRGAVMATGYLKGGIVGRQGIAGTAEMCEALGVPPESPSFPPAVLAWLEADRLIRA
ncbi:thioesterase family protein [Burkholderia alba]|uniref:thioesterase family protein n=1 Tax=Burkholderia alba TaxID=2683677 RepID=UPI002B05E66C|nr:thioesterase family protein [Burkholderia alba]